MTHEYIVAIILTAISNTIVFWLHSHEDKKMFDIIMPTLAKLIVENEKLNKRIEELEKH